MRGWEGDSEGMHEGATDGMRGWEGDSEGIHEGAIKEVKVTEVGETNEYWKAERNTRQCMSVLCSYASCSFC